MDRQSAQNYIDRIYASEDPSVAYKTHRPITDLKDMLVSSAEMFGDNVAFMQRYQKSEPFKKITYKEMYEDVKCIGTALIDLGLKDERIAIVGDNGVEWATAYLAIMTGVGICVPLDKELKIESILGLMRNADVKAVFYTKKFSEPFRKIKEQGGYLPPYLINMQAQEDDDLSFSRSSLIERGRVLLESGDRRYLDAEIDGSKMGALIYTSGTTGLAKGVMLSQDNIIADLMSAPNVVEIVDSDIFFSVLPVHHTYECTSGFLMPLYRGAAIGYCEGLKYIQKNLQEIKPTVFLLVPLLLEGLYKTIWKNIKKQGKEKTVKRIMQFNRVTSHIGINLNKTFLKSITDVFGGNLDLIICGGAAINPEILDFFNDIGITTIQGYGLTECAPMAALNSDQLKYRRSDSIGRALPNVEIRIDYPDEDGNGEICIKGENVMLGYYNMPEETAEVLKDGWFYTGDVGYIDEKGFVFLTGRRKNVIITKNGKNVFPEEIEHYIQKISQVEESMVWAANDEAGHDTKIAATIRPNMEELRMAIGDDAEDEKKVEEFFKNEIDKINDELPSFKQIRMIHIRYEEFEKTTSKKIKRFVMENRY